MAERADNLAIHSLFIDGCKEAIGPDLAWKLFEEAYEIQTAHESFGWAVNNIQKFNHHSLFKCNLLQAI